jgi:excisionase family DNA binding protein
VNVHMNTPSQSKGGDSQGRLAVSRGEAAAMLGISARLLWTWTNAGQIPHVRIGARVLYPVEQLREWLGKQASTTNPKPEN